MYCQKADTDALAQNQHAANGKYSYNILTKPFPFHPVTSEQ